MIVVKVLETIGITLAVIVALAVFLFTDAAFWLIVAVLAVAVFVGIPYEVWQAL